MPEVDPGSALAGRRIVVVGGSAAPAAVDALIAAGAEVHSIDRHRFETSWLASRTVLDLEDEEAIVEAIGRIGAIVDELHLFVAPGAAAVAALVAAAESRSGPRGLRVVGPPTS